MELQVFNIKRLIVFNGLNRGCILKIFLKDFANISLDILIKYFSYKKRVYSIRKGRPRGFPMNFPKLNSQNMKNKRIQIKIISVHTKRYHVNDF